jgi:hypothetical protein
MAARASLTWQCKDTETRESRDRENNTPAGFTQKKSKVPSRQIQKVSTASRPHFSITLSD